MKWKDWLLFGDFLRILELIMLDGIRFGVNWICFEFNLNILLIVLIKSVFVSLGILMRRLCFFVSRVMSVWLIILCWLKMIVLIVFWVVWSCLVVFFKFWIGVLWGFFCMNYLYWLCVGWGMRDYYLCWC